VIRGTVAKSAQIKAAQCDLLAVGVGTGPDGLEPGQGAASVGARYGIDLAATAEARGFTGAAGKSLVIDLPVLHTASRWGGLAPAIVLLGVGQASAGEYRQAGTELARVAGSRHRAAGGSQTVASAAAPAESKATLETVRRGTKAGRLPARAGGTPPPPGRITATLAAGAAERTEALVEGYLSGSYRRPRSGLKAAGQPHRTWELTLLGSHDRTAVTRGQAIGAMEALARDLTNWPSNHKTPATFTASAQAAAATREAIELQVLAPENLKLAGLEAILAVGSGAWRGPAADPERSPRLLIATYDPPSVKGAPHLVVVGKGCTFDTGGLDLKPNSAMLGMRTDMTGAAAALATTLGAADLKLPIKVSAVMPLAQNSLGSAAFRPSDVVTVYGGTTVEVGDTDAEGRLLMADALSYAAANLRPDYLIDIATLTGAVRVALGTQTGGLFTADDLLAARLEEAGAAAGEDWWRLPLVEDYAAGLESDSADVASIARPGLGGGAITAALFLRRFTASARWAHLDIAGAARKSATAGAASPDATGFGVRSLIRLAERLA
jgi:leucyl aminopeptidase